MEPGGPVYGIHPSQTPPVGLVTSGMTVHVTELAEGDSPLVRVLPAHGPGLSVSQVVSLNVKRGATPKAWLPSDSFQVGG